MPTTSLKLPDELKQRAGFVAEAQAAREQMLKTGKGYDAGEVHTWLKARIMGSTLAKPKTRPWQGRADPDGRWPTSKG